MITVRKYRLHDCERSLNKNKHNALFSLPIPREGIYRGLSVSERFFKGPFHCYLLYKAMKITTQKESPSSSSLPSSIPSERPKQKIVRLSYRPSRYSPPRATLSLENMAAEFEKKQVSSLVALPNEILYQVANYLEYADDASALSRSCRFLYSLVSPTLIARYAKSHQKQVIRYALEIGDHILLQRFLEAGVELDRYVCKEMFTNAAERGYTELLRFLQDANLGGDPKETREYNLSFLSAVLHERWETARFLVSRGADPNYSDPWELRPNALNAMVERGCLDGVRFQVEEGVSSLEYRWKGRTPLMNAARCGSLDVVKYLIAAGAKHRAKDNSGRTAIFHAAH